MERWLSYRHKGLTTVYVTGAVEEAKVVTVPKDAGPEAVLQSIQMRIDADRASFLRRKKIKNGEVIKIRPKRQRRVHEQLPKRHSAQNDLFGTFGSPSSASEQVRLWHRCRTVLQKSSPNELAKEPLFIVEKARDLLAYLFRLSSESSFFRETKRIDRSLRVQGRL